MYNFFFIGLVKALISPKSSYLTFGGDGLDDLLCMIYHICHGTTAFSGNKITRRKLIFNMTDA